MAKELLDIANKIYFLRFRVVWRFGCVTNTFARTFARFARTLPTPLKLALVSVTERQALGIKSLFAWQRRK
jgi:hypothetical protein